ncbi:MAG: methyltransferase [Thaumarchaeota archaeon]|nr:methyltransferase [Nitrososphaerota archaeon]
MSGEHDRLPAAEVEAVFEAENVPRIVLEGFTQVYRFTAPLEPASKAFKRLALSHFLCEEIGVFKQDVSCDEIIGKVVEAGLNGSIAFRVRRIRCSISPEKASALETGLNRKASKTVRLVVDLENPENNLEVVSSNGFIIVGRRVCSSARRSVMARSGGRKPFFHPSSLKVELARTMLNLARVREGSIVVDPFSGTGTVLVEACKLQTHPIGLDVDPLMAYSSRRNYRWFQTLVFQVLGDARHMPFRRADAVVTDPPYGRRASTHGFESLRLYECFIKEASRILRDEGWLVFLAPSRLHVEEALEHNGFKLRETFLIEVHSNLTRKLLVAFRG